MDFAKIEAGRLELDQQVVDVHRVVSACMTLRNGEAIAVGEGVSIPVRLCFEELPKECRPKSGTAPFSAAWRDDWDDKEFLDQIVHRWPRQLR